MNEIALAAPEIREAFRPEDYSFTVDWLNVRLDCDDLWTVILRIINKLPELSVSDFERRPSGGVCWYKNAYYIPKIGYSSFLLAFNCDVNDQIINTPGERGQLFGILLSISGDGCRFINSLHENAFADLIEAISIFNPHCSRIDVACDIFDRDNCLVPMIQTFADYAYDRSNAPIDLVCNLVRKPDWVTCSLNYDCNVGDFTRNVTIGGRSSTKGTLQLYNKRVEVMSKRLSEHSEAILNSVGNPEYWWRLEYRCKSYAQNVFDILFQSKDIFKTFVAAAKGFGNFCVPVYDYDISKSEDLLEWISFLSFVESLSDNSSLIKYNSEFVNLPYVPMNLSRVERFCMKQIHGPNTIHFFRCLLDPEYRRRYLDRCLMDYHYNKKLKPAFEELRQQYGYKLTECADLIFEQVNITL